jgi:hypothetical protein
MKTPLITVLMTIMDVPTRNTVRTKYSPSNGNTGSMTAPAASARPTLIPSLMLKISINPSKTSIGTIIPDNACACASLALDCAMSLSPRPLE